MHSCLCSQIAGRILNRKYEKAGRDVNVLISPNSDVYNPTFEEKIELREPNMSATSTILLKVINEVTLIIAPSLPNTSRFTSWLVSDLYNRQVLQEIHANRFCFAQYFCRSRNKQTAVRRRWRCPGDEQSTVLPSFNPNYHLFIPY